MKFYIKLLPFLFLLFYLPNFSYPAVISWHDSQRFAIIFILIYSLILFKFAKIDIGKRSGYLLATFLALAAFSICLSKSPLWALTEFSVTIGLVSIIFSINYVSYNSEEKSKNFFFYTLCLTCLAIDLNFLLNYTLSIISSNSIDLWLLIPGFNNPRFFGQFCTIAIPILAIPLCYHFKWRWLYYILFSLLICAVITSGTRGTVLGIGASLLIIFFLSKKWKLYFCNILPVFAVGLGLHVVLLQCIPKFFFKNLLNNSAERMNFSLSAREILWEKAYQMIVEQPIVGYGPMHFASVDSIASHPHQIILQIGSERGVPILLLCLIFAGFIFNKCLKVLRDENSSITYTFLFGALSASLAQSMVDGVFVMPYIQYCFFVCAAFLYIEHRLNTKKENFHKNECNTISNYAIKGIALISIFVLAFSLYPNSTTSYQTSQKKEIKGFLKPRYWLNGQI